MLAILLNEVGHSRFKRTIQSLSYLPHFISWIVVAYILYTMLALDTGVINLALRTLGFPQVNFMGRPEYFRTIVVASAIWKEIGWRYHHLSCRDRHDRPAVARRPRSWMVPAASHAFATSTSPA